MTSSLFFQWVGEQDRAERLAAGEYDDEPAESDEAREATEHASAEETARSDATSPAASPAGE